MGVLKNHSIRWGVIFLCLIMGTWLGIFFQSFPATTVLFKNVADFSINIKEIDFIMLRLGFLFGIKINLGTLIGAITGLLITR